MARTTSKLSALDVSRVTKPGMYGDGGGLWLQVTGRGDDEPPAKSWLFRFMLNGKARAMGLGPLHTVTLAQARAKAAECRSLCRDGHDPITARRAAKQEALAEAGRAVTFREAAKRYIASHKAAWRNAKHAAQWESTLATYAYPKIGALHVGAIGTSEVIGILEPIWPTKTETAKRVRGRIEAILDFARVRGWREGENPARWKGHLDHILPRASKVRAVKHHAALPYAELPAFLAKLRQQEGVAASALEFAILTAARTGEVIGATHAEVDLQAAMWTIPAERMKAGAEHRVPLTERAVAIAREMMDAGLGDYLFPGGKHGKPLSNMAMAALLKRMGYGHITVHGFRSTFRDWSAEQTNYPREVAEAALAHANGDKVEAAYLRADMLEKRRRLMEAWARYCANERPAGGASVSAIRAAVG